MRRQSAAIVFVVVLAAAAAGTTLAELDFGSVGKASANLSAYAPTEAVPSNCTTTFSGGLPTRESGNESRLFTLLPGSTGLICVTYSIDTGSLSTANETIHFGSEVYLVKATYENNSDGEGFGYSYAYQPAPGLTESADPSSANLQQGKGNFTITVVYSITASENATGFDSLSFTSSCPALIPFAVTTEGRGVTPSDFTGFFFESGCVKESPISQALVTGIAEMNTSLLDGQ